MWWVCQVLCMSAGMCIVTGPLVLYRLRNLPSFGQIRAMCNNETLCIEKRSPKSALLKDATSKFLSPIRVFHALA